MLGGGRFSPPWEVRGVRCSEVHMRENAYLEVRYQNTRVMFKKRHDSETEQTDRCRAIPLRPQAGEAVRPLEGHARSPPP